MITRGGPILVAAFLLIVGSPLVLPYKVLITSVGMSSSQNLFFYRLGELLAEAGHDVTVLNSVILPEMKRPKPVRIKEISYRAVTDEQEQFARESMNTV